MDLRSYRYINTDSKLTSTINQWTPLHAAAQKAHSEAIKILLDGGAKINSPDKDQATPLHLAAQKGHSEAIKILLDGGAEVNAPTKNQWTPLYLAALNGHSEAIEILLDGGAKANAQDKNQWTSLHLAAQCGYSEAVNILLDGGAKINAQDEDQSTPLHLAALNGHSIAIKTLLDGGADINAQNKDRCTPLDLVAQDRDSDAIRTLLDRGACVSAQNKGGRAPIHIAAQSNTSEAVTALDEGAGFDVRKASQGSPKQKFHFERNFDDAELRHLYYERTCELEHNSSKDTFEALESRVHDYAVLFDAHLPKEGKQEKCESEELIRQLINFRKEILPYPVDPNQRRIRVTIIDTGVEGTHPYIRHIFARRQSQENVRPRPSSGMNNEQGRESMPPCGLLFRDFVEPESPEPIDEDGHGTFIAGLIFQLAPDVELSVARIGRSRSSIAADPKLHDKIADAVEHAVKTWKSDIISMSIGFKKLPLKLKNAFNFAIDRNIILLAAAGNYGNRGSLQYPAKLSRVFKIFATDAYGYKVYISPPSEERNYTFGALGCAVTSIWPTTLCSEQETKGLEISKKQLRSKRSKIGTGGDTNEVDFGTWTVMSGTSFSTPIVAALVAILYQFYDTNRPFIKLSTHSQGLRQIDAVCAVLKHMSRTSSEDNYNYIEPMTGRDDHFLFKAERFVPSPNGRKIELDRMGCDRVKHFAERLADTIDRADV